jgi:hypothetical protein
MTNLDLVDVDLPRIREVEEHVERVHGRLALLLGSAIGQKPRY